MSEELEVGRNEEWERNEEEKIKNNIEHSFELLRQGVGGGAGEDQSSSSSNDKKEMAEIEKAQELVWIPMMKRIFLEKTRKWAEEKKNGVKYVDPGIKAHEQALGIDGLMKEEEKKLHKLLVQSKRLSALLNHRRKNQEPSLELDLSEKGLKEHKENVEMAQALFKEVFKVPMNTKQGLLLWNQTRKVFNSVMYKDAQISCAMYRIRMTNYKSISN